MQLQQEPGSKPGPSKAGEHNGNAKLTEADVLAIRRRHGELIRTLCATYGITAKHVHRIVRGTRWQHLKDAAP